MSTEQRPDALADLLLARVDAGDLGDRAQLLVLAAYEGDHDLAQVTADAGWTQPRRPPASAKGDESAVDGAYLTRVAVTGFRGIGPTAVLELQPGPGLTVVVGRNGSGKSSFAEGLEAALTGDSQRWADRPAAWKDGWRNLHHEGDATVEAQVLEDERRGRTTVVRTWSGTGVGDSTATVQRTGEPRAPLEELGWARALETYRPFLSYNELGQMLSGRPSELYDAVAEILGLERLADAEKRLRATRAELDKEHKEATSTLKALREAAAALPDDPRAQQVLAATGGTSWDLDAVEEALHDDTSDAASELRALRALVGFAAPGLDAVETVARELREAGEGVAAAAGSDAARARDTARLLQQALEASEGARCPVCGTADVLDDAWRERTAAEVQRLQAEAASVEAAVERLDRARVAAAELRSPVPQVLRDGGPGVDTDEAHDAWAAFVEVALDGPAAEVADALEEHGVPLHDAVRRVSDAAAVEVQRRQDSWSPLAQRFSAWLLRARDVEACRSLRADVASATTWLAEQTEQLRNDRLAPLAAASRTIWETLRQESDVELGPLLLEGRGNRRRLALDVTVGGSDAGALGVMSQGELHALALALFLPRATLPESPFRFLVVDDPVQAMDPSKVDGLARVLAEVAAGRQVVVFTHDDRLPEAVRRLRIEARVLQVLRRERSQVEVTSLSDPVQRALQDAETVARSSLDLALRREAVPGLCRGAVEAACHETVRRRRLGRGENHAAVEDAIVAAQTLTQTVALALLDDADRGGDVFGRLNAPGRWAGDTFRILKEGAHGGFSGDPHDLVRDARLLVEVVRR